MIFLHLLENDEDRERFTVIYEANHLRMEKLAAHILGAGPQAEDAVHDAFLQLIRKFAEARDWTEERTAAWLAVVLRNRALDMLRHDRFETELPEFWEPVVPADQGEFRTLVALIREMPEAYRQVLELRFVAEWGLAEIGEALGISENTVKSRVVRGRKLLIERLRKEGYQDGTAFV